MDRILLSVLYLSGWSISSHLSHRYHFVADPMNWTEAQTYCRSTHSDLATIENAGDMDQLISTVSSAGHSSEVWIGLYSTIDWKWSDSYSGAGAEYRKWDNYNDNEPDIYSGDQFCVCVAYDAGWWDRTCSVKYPFICYRGTPLNPEFVFVGERMSWSQAQRYCRENFVDLATVTNSNENQKLRNMVSGDDFAWIGLFRDPHIYWSDGRGYDFRYWDIGSNPVEPMICGAAALQTSGKWKFFSCETKKTFVCNSVPPPPVTRQVVRLRFEPEDPSVNLNDPAVKADILTKFQERLKANGVTGVTLKWREQPDGKVFHKERENSQKKNRKKTEL